MIYEKGGQARSVRTSAETMKTLQHELEALSAEERETFEILLKELREREDGKTPRLLNKLSQEEYIRTPVDMKTFILDPYYLGQTCTEIFPRLLDDLVELCEGDYQEAIFTGAIGTGKTFAASIGICRVLYELSCMKNPHKSYGLASDSNISIVGLSVSEQLATKVVFENIATKIRASKYFQEHFPFEYTKKELRFPKHIWVAARASTDTSALGLNTIGALLDETNFMPKPNRNLRGAGNQDVQDRAEILYATIQRRMKSRFSRNGKLPGMIFLVSSKKTPDDFTARRVRESLQDPTVFVRDYSLWDVKPTSYSEKKFFVLAGNEQVRSRILDEPEVENVRATLPEGAVLIEVPIDFRRDFARDLEGSIRDIAGVSTLAISPFIQRRERIQEGVDSERQHPFSSEVCDLSKGGFFLWEKMVRAATPREMRYGDKSMIPILSPRANRHVHLDPSLKVDALGFCVGHVGGWKEVIRKTEDGKQFSELAPVYVIDVLLRVIPPVAGEIILGEVRSLIYDLSAHGYVITKVTTDGYQSADTVQQLQSKGYQADVLSVDKKPEPYLEVKLALYEGRLRFYHYTPLLDELKRLEWDPAKKKVDHPPKGSKDVADALAGCVATLSESRASDPLPFLSSIPHYGPPSTMNTGEMDTPFREFEGAGVLPPFFRGPVTDEWYS